MKWKTTHFFILVSALVFLGVNTAQSEIVSSTNFTVQNPLIKRGSGFSTSSNFKLWSSIGEEAIGFSTATVFNIKAGFLYLPSSLINISVSTTSVSTTTSPSVIIAPAGGGGGYTLTPRLRSPLGLEAADLNSDGVVSISDLSVILYYQYRPSGNISKYDLNKDGKIDIVDISILLYYWTLR